MCMRMCMCMCMRMCIRTCTHTYVYVLIGHCTSIKRNNIFLSRAQCVLRACVVILSVLSRAVEGHPLVLSLFFFSFFFLKTADRMQHPCVDEKQKKKRGLIWYHSSAVAACAFLECSISAILTWFRSDINVRSLLSE